jgi:hypothetical protein
MEPRASTDKKKECNPMQDDQQPFSRRSRLGYADAPFAGRLAGRPVRALLAGMTWLLLRRSHLYEDLARLHLASAKPQAI